MVKEVENSSEFYELIKTPNKLVVVDFTATWCGPCRRVAPQYDALAFQFPDVMFLKVWEHNEKTKDVFMACGIRAFPTFNFYIGGQVVDTVQGANINAVEQKVKELSTRITPSFAGGGATLGSGGDAPLDPREARMRRFGANANPGGATTTSTDQTASHLAAAMALSFANASAAAAAQQQQQQQQPAPQTVPIDPEVLKQLTEMGFAEVRSRKALRHHRDLEGAIGWLMDHQDDPDIDEEEKEEKEENTTAAAHPPSSPTATTTAPGGSLPPGAAAAPTDGAPVDAATAQMLATAAAAASALGGAVSTTPPRPPTPLTAEEKARKVQELKEKMAAKRREREEAEKVLDIDREKVRRESGKKILETKEEVERLQRRREAEMLKKEKNDAKREKERILAEIAKDKAERKARGGKLSGKLGVEGYNPAGVQGEYGDGAAPADGEGGGEGGGGNRSSGSGSGSAQAKADSLSPEERIDKAIQTLGRYRSGGDGGTALKTLLAYIKNVLKDPANEKYRTIPLENEAFKKRVASLVGGVALLKAVGFEKREQEKVEGGSGGGEGGGGEGGGDGEGAGMTVVVTVLCLDADKVKVELLSETKEKLAIALEEYRQRNE